jgi:Homeodomain-like domain
VLSTSARVMDAAQRLALEQLCRHALAAELDELEARVAQLERRLGPRSFARHELDRQRRAAVLHARRQGLSIAMIAAALGLGTSTVAAILEAEQVDEPERVRGRDGKLHPARHRNGDRPAAERPAGGVHSAQRFG